MNLPQVSIQNYEKILQNKKIAIFMAKIYVIEGTKGVRKNN